MSSEASTAIRATPGRAGSQVHATCPSRICSPVPASLFPPIRSVRVSAIQTTSLPIATRALAPRSRRSRSAPPATEPATTPARGTSGRVTTTCRSSEASPEQLGSDPGSFGLSRGRDALGCFDEAGTHVPAELVPLVDPLPGLREQHVLVDRKVFLFLDPVLHLAEGHLRMKLDAPRVLAEPEPLRADPIPRELDSARRDPVVVVVPLEGFEGVWQSPEHRVLDTRIRELDGEPADLELTRRLDGRLCGLRKQLRTEADAEHGQVEVEQPLQEEAFFAEPRMVEILVGVHGAAEDQHGPVGVDRFRQRRVPGKAPLLEPVASLAHDVSEHT